MQYRRGGGPSESETSRSSEELSAAWLRNHVGMFTDELGLKGLVASTLLVLEHISYKGNRTCPRTARPRPKKSYAKSSCSFFETISIFCPLKNEFFVFVGSGMRIACYHGLPVFLC